MGMLEFGDTVSETSPKFDLIHTLAGLASVGQGKWLWCVWPPASDGLLPSISKTDPAFWGYESTKEAGLDRILEATGARGFWSRDDWHQGMTPWQREQAWRQASRNGVDLHKRPEDALYYPVALYATHWRHTMAERRRKPNIKAKDAKTTEFLYHGPRFWGGNAVCKHRILKKTAKRIFFEAGCHCEHGTMSLDRAKLEAAAKKGEGVWVHHGHFRGLMCGAVFSLINPASLPDAAREIPACIAALGLRWPTTEKAVKQAFRKKSHSAHPDRGGSSEAFIHLQEHYQQALAMICNAGAEK